MALKLQQLLVDSGIDTSLKQIGASTRAPLSSRATSCVSVLSCTRVGDYIISAAVVSDIAVNALNLREVERIAVKVTSSGFFRVDQPIQNILATVDLAHTYIIGHLPKTLTNHVHSLHQRRLPPVRPRKSHANLQERAVSSS